MVRLFLIFTFCFVGVVFADGASGVDASSIVKKQCARCHGINMEKKALNKSGITNELTPEVIKEDLLAYRAGKLNRYGMGATMHTTTKKLTDAEIEALSNYIPTLKSKGK